MKKHTAKTAEKENSLSVLKITGEGFKITLSGELLKQALSRSQEREITPTRAGVELILEKIKKYKA